MNLENWNRKLLVFRLRLKKTVEFGNFSQMRFSSFSLSDIVCADYCLKNWFQLKESKKNLQSWKGTVNLANQNVE